MFTQVTADHEAEQWVGSDGEHEMSYIEMRLLCHPWTTWRVTGNNGRHRRAAMYRSNTEYMHSRLCTCTSYKLTYIRTFPLQYISTKEWRGRVGDGFSVSLSTSLFSNSRYPWWDYSWIFGLFVENHKTANGLDIYRNSTVFSHMKKQPPEQFKHIYSLI